MNRRPDQVSKSASRKQCEIHSEVPLKRLPKIFQLEERGSTITRREVEGKIIKFVYDNPRTEARCNPRTLITRNKRITNQIRIVHGVF